MDYAFLKQKGIALLQELSGKVWTDYNAHDPGVTILEQLCYAITDIAYRIHFHIEDFIAPEAAGDAAGQLKHFFAPAEIYPVSPLTILDFRKLVLDTEGVLNCRIKALHARQAVKGGYRVLIDVEEKISGSAAKVAALRREVLHKLYRHRNLGEDFFEVTVLEAQALRIQARVEVGLVANPEEVLARIYHRLQHQVSPGVKFYSFQEMRHKKFSTDEIYEGPLLRNGFIPDQELAASNIPNKIYTVNLIEAITSIREVINIHHFSAATDRAPLPEKEYFIRKDKGKALKLVFDCEAPGIVLVHQNQEVKINPDRLKRRLRELQIKHTRKRPFYQQARQAAPAARPPMAFRYHSIQHHFPLNYGIGADGLPKSVGPLRQAQARQLKGYLLFFEQLLANYLAQLGGVKYLFALNQAPAKTYFTQYPADVPAIADLLNPQHQAAAARRPNQFIDVLARRFNLRWREFLASTGLEMPHKLEQITEDRSTYENRSNKLADHLLARFNEDFSDYAFFSKHFWKDKAAAITRDHKINFLKDYAGLGQDRSRGYNLADAGFDRSSNVSGLERLLGYKLGIRDVSRRPLAGNLRTRIGHTRGAQLLPDLFFRHLEQSRTQRAWAEQAVAFHALEPIRKEAIIRWGMHPANYDIHQDQQGRMRIRLYTDEDKAGAVDVLLAADPWHSREQAAQAIRDIAAFFTELNAASEGMHLVEHILLRPADTLQDTVDYYSFRITLALPSWPARFQDQAFKNLLYKTLVEVAPAHLFINVLWLDLGAMEAFERLFRQWLEWRATEAPGSSRLRAASDRLFQFILDHGPGIGAPPL